MTAANFKTIIIGLASLLVVSVAHGKCYPGLDCPEDLPGANNTPNPPAPSTNQQVPEPTPDPVSLPEPTIESQALPEEQSTPENGNVVGRKIDDVPEEPAAPSKYRKYKYPR